MPRDAHWFRRIAKSQASKKHTHSFRTQDHRAVDFDVRAGRSVPTRKEPVSKKKGPPDYPGDEAIQQKLGDALRKLRLEKGLSLAQVDAFLDERTEEDAHPFLARAFSLVTRELREARKMSRVQLSEASGLPLSLIHRVERAKADNLTLTQVMRMAMALDYHVADFVEQVLEMEERLKEK